MIKEGIKKLVPELKADRQSEEDASWAILTTDTKPKEAAVEVEIDGKTVTIAGMCKGSGMIHQTWEQCLDLSLQMQQSIKLYY